MVEEIMAIFDKLSDTRKASANDFATSLLNMEANREKTPDERIDEYVAGGCVGQCDTRGFTRENFIRLSSLMPRVPVQY